MAGDWIDEVRKYAPDAEPGIVAGIVRYCGIALRTPDASHVTFGDAMETARVRDHYCRNKLGLTESNANIDAAIQNVGARMGNPATGDRVTVYYLLAQHFGKLGLFAGAAASPAAAHAVASGARRNDRTGSTAVIGCGLLAGAILATAAAATFFTHPLDPGPGVPASVAVANGPPPVYAVPAAVAGPVIPEGAGVLARDVAGKPQVSVYFATAKADVAPGFATTAAPAKAWLDSHAGARLQVSGFNDPRGNAAFNAALSKHRAQNVAAALSALGVSAASIDLVKPVDTTDTDTTQAEARRVDITVVGAP